MKELKCLIYGSKTDARCAVINIPSLSYTERVLKVDLFDKLASLYEEYDTDKQEFKIVYVG
jgi:hypothetical protein